MLDTHDITCDYSLVDIEPHLPIISQREKTWRLGESLEY